MPHLDGRVQWRRCKLDIVAVRNRFHWKRFFKNKVASHRRDTPTSWFSCSSWLVHSLSEPILWGSIQYYGFAQFGCGKAEIISPVLTSNAVRDIVAKRNNKTFFFNGHYPPFPVPRHHDRGYAPELEFLLLLSPYSVSVKKEDHCGWLPSDTPTNIARNNTFKLEVWYRNSWY